jgi:hypothetical protein
MAGGVRDVSLIRLATRAAVRADHAVSGVPA